MKTCKECGLGYEDKFLFCTEDGTPLSSGGVVQETCQEAAVFEPGEPAVQPELNQEPAAKAPVLYCPACGAEYPLTFSNCLVDGLKLTRVPPFASRVPALTLTAEEGPIDDPGPAGETMPLDSPESDGREGSDLAVGEAANQFVSRTGEDEPDYEDTIPNPEASRAESSYVRGYEVEESDYDADLEQVSPSPHPERPSFRIAAKGLIVGLGLFTLATLYVIYNGSTRRPSVSPLKNMPRSEVAEQSLPFIPTPQVARDYKEDAAKEENPERGGESSPPVAAESKPKVQDQPVDRPRIVSPAVTPQTPARPVDISTPVRHVATEGRINSRLVRVRGRKTPAGYRYDLTFNLQEQAGRSLHWNRLSISSISASGLQHVETIPFSHRLGGSGLLTFTVSIEMRGSREADWQGRIVCTSLGSDDAGKPIRATFGANVSP